jgi:hypothetical protein
MGRMVAALTYVANECNTDVEKYRAKAEAGGGWIASYLKENSSKISKPCSEARANVGVK